MPHVEDRWMRTVRQPDGSKKDEPTSRNGIGKKWRVRYTDPSGRERSKSFDRKADADKFNLKITADLAASSYVDPAAGKITLRAYSEKWLAAQQFRSETTKEEVTRRLRRHILPVLGDSTLAELAQGTSQIRGWLGGLTVTSERTGESRPVAPSYGANMLTMLSSIFAAAVDDGRIARNPCKAKTVKAPRPDKTSLVPWESAEVAAVRDGMPDSLRAMCDAGAGLGLRQGEVFALDPHDIDWLRGIVHVRRNVLVAGGRLCFDLPKGHRERDVPLPEEVHERLSAHLAAHPAVSITLPWQRPGGKMRTAELMFTSSTGKALRRTWFNDYPWIRALKAAGITPGYPNGFHMLRHHYASVLLRDGVDVRTLAEYLGHHDPGFTLRTYIHLMVGAEDRVRAAVDAALRSGSNGPETYPRRQSG